MMYDFLSSMMNMASGIDSDIDFTELDKLAKGLRRRGIDYQRRPLYDGEQIACDGWDAVCHSGSYGHEDGLLEIMGRIVQNDDDTVEGYLTAEDILERL